MQVEFWNQVSYLPRSLGKQRQDSALKAFLQIPHSGTPQLDRSATQRQSPLLAVAVAIATGCVYFSATLILSSSQQLRHFILQQFLYVKLDLLSHPLFQLFKADS